MATYQEIRVVPRSSFVPEIRDYFRDFFIPRNRVSNSYLHVAMVLCIKQETMLRYYIKGGNYD